MQSLVRFNRVPANWEKEPCWTVEPGLALPKPPGTFRMFSGTLLNLTQCLHRSYSGLKAPLAYAVGEKDGVWQSCVWQRCVEGGAGGGGAGYRIKNKNPTQRGEEQTTLHAQKMVSIGHWSFRNAIELNWNYFQLYILISTCLLQVYSAASAAICTSSGSFETNIPRHALILPCL